MKPTDFQFRPAISIVALLSFLFAAVPWVSGQSYQYDAGSRLTNATYSDGKSISYTYDAAGNQLSVSTSGGTAAAPSFSIQPTPESIDAGGNATFTAAATGSPAPTYQWQVSTNSGSSWTDLTDTAPYSNTKAGTLTVTGATMSLNGNQYHCVATNASGSVPSDAATLTVNQAVPVITWPAPAAIIYGTALSGAQLDATASVPGTLVYSPVAGTVLSAGAHTLHVTFTPTDRTDYNTATATQIVTVSKAVPVITWPAPAAITYPTPLSGTQLNATANVPGAFVYSPASEAVLTAGTQTLRAYFTPTDRTDYTSVTATQKLTVNQAVPVITWPAPAAITYPTPLSGTQLDATANVPGAFVYSPAAGTVLTANIRTLSVRFTPTDTTDYTTATATQKLTVNKAVPVITWPVPAAITYGTALSGAQLDATANVPGAFVYSPAAGTVLKAGTQTLSVTFTPTDTTDYTAATATQKLTVNKAVPVITWPVPAAITYPTPLSAAQLDATANVPGAFVYTPAAGTVLNAGTQTLSVTFTPTDTTDYTTAIATKSLTVNKAVPVITWPAPAAITYGMALSATQLDATANVPGAFVYSPAAGTVLTANIRTLSVRFTPTDTTDYTTATATQKLTVNKAVPVITWPVPAAITYGTALSGAQLDATANVPGAFVYSPAAGTVLKAGTQTLSVTFTPTDTTDYTAATATQKLTVNKAVPVITWPAPAAITYPTPLSGAQLDATANVPGAFVYSPAAGTILTANIRTLTVKFTPTDTTDYTAATATQKLTVNKAVPVITWPAPAAITYPTPLSGAQLDATANVPGIFVYSPAAGTVLKAGTQTLNVTFTPTDTTDYATALATKSLTVNKAIPVITWPVPAAIIYGTALSGAQLDATANVPGAFVYTPAAGTVLTVGTQTLGVKFTPTDTTDYATATATQKLTVNKAVPVITWPAPAAITYGTALSGAQLDATANVPGAFAYSPAAGTVLKAGTQTLSVTFTPTDTTDYTAATATQKLTVNKAVPVITWPAPAAITYGTALSGAQLDATANVPGAFVYTPAAGTVLTANIRTLTVKFTPTDTTDYATALATKSLTVNKATPVITWPAPAAITYGTALSGAQLDATANVPGAFVYTPAAGTVLKTGTQTLSVTFTPTDTTDYTAATATQKLTVNKAVPVITWPVPAAIIYGTALSGAQLDATANVPGAFVYTPAAGTVLKAGTQTLSVTFTPTDTTDYATALATKSLTVNKAIPVITWPVPAAIIYGTALSGAQLDATANVPGAFVYTPAAGTVLKAGTQTLSVNLTPTDTTDYTTATATQKLTVNKAVPVITWPAPAAIIYGTALSGAQLDATANVPGAFVYTPAAGKVLTAGTQTLSVNLTPTDTTDYTTATATQKLTVNKAVPVITWPAPAAIIYGTALSGAQLDATANVPGAFVYTPAAGTVLKAGTQTLSVKFTPTDTTDYATMTATQKLTVNKAVPVITWPAPAAIAYGTALSGAQLDATANVPGAFVYTPAAGTVLPVGTQTLGVKFTPTDTTDYATATATQKLTVNKAVPVITWAAPAAITYPTPLSGAQLDATANVPGAFAYTPAAGTVLTANIRSLSVRFTPTDTTDYTTATATQKLTVNKAVPVITWAAPAAITYGTALSATQLDATANVPGAFVYTPAAGKVLTAGTQTLSVNLTPTDTTDYTTATATQKLTVNKAVPVITWPAPAAIIYGTALSGAQLDATANVPGAFVYTPAAGTVLKAGTQTLSVKFTPTDTTDYATMTATQKLTVNKAVPVITWPAPAAIAYGTALSGAQLDATANVPGAFVYTPAAGTVLPVGTQTLGVKFTPTDTTDYATATATQKLTVNKAVPVITWAAPAAITYGTALSATQLDATANVPGAFVYTPTAGTVLNAGTQTLSVTFTPTDTTDYATAIATKSLTVNQAIPVITWPPPAAITYPTPLSGTQLDATANVPGAFVYSPAAGTVLTANIRSLSVRFTPTDTTDYSIATATQKLTVNKAVPVITWPAPAAITYGTALSATQLDATANVPGAFVYTPAAGKVLTAGTQTLSVTFTPTDTTDYATATATQKLTVNQAVPVITWPAPAAITYPTPLSGTQLDATANVPGAFAYSPAAGTVLTANIRSLSVRFTPTDTTDYTIATATQKLTVNKAVPVITWPAPAAITYGTALSATQLDATANVPGAFVYTPAAGVVLNVGAQTLSVKFTPTDTTDYTTATATQTLTVTSANSQASLQQLFVTKPLTVSTLAGQALSSGSSDGTGSTARFHYLSGITSDNAGNLYIADTDNHTIRKIVASTGEVTTMAGLAGSPGSADGTCSNARFNNPSGVAVDSAGNVYVADTLNHTLREITSLGVVSTLAGSPGTAGSSDGTGSDARFQGPQGLAIDTGSNLYVADTNNHTIRKVVPATRVVTTVAGLAGNAGSSDGLGSTARFNSPCGISVDSAGNLFVADTENHTIREILASGSVSTLAGLAGNSGGTDGAGSSARFDSPSDVAADSSGNVYVADTDNHTIREVAPSTGAVTTLAGLAGTSGSTDGLGSAVRFFHPTGIAVDSSSNLYVSDTDNHTVRVGLLAMAPAIQTQSQSKTVTAGNSVSFSITATGRPAVTYQWYFNGAPISGATGDSYSIASAQAGDAGNYTVVVSNVVGDVTSDPPATLTVNPPPPSGGGGGGAPGL